VAGMPFLPAPLTPEPFTQDAYVPVNPPINATTFGGVNAQMVQAQMMQAQIPFAGAVDLAHNFGKTGTEPVPAHNLLGYVPDDIKGSSGPNGSVSGPVGVPVPVMDGNPSGAWTNASLYCSDRGALGGWMGTGSVPTRNGMNVKIESLRVRGVRSPPRAYDGNASRLYDRLIREGADAIAAGVLCEIIFAGGVTFEALKAPIQTWEMFLAYGGATRMWQLLLETKEVTPGKKTYRCLLCPVENRKEYKHDRDAVRHFNRDHFGFGFPCEYW
jgi:hypothetical protein